MRLEWRNVELPLPGGGTRAIYTSVTPAETEELRRLANGKRVLEIGSAYGYSTVVMAEVAEEVTSIDPHLTHDSLEAIQENLHAFRVEDRVNLLIGTSQAMLPQQPRRYYGMVFIDGDHTLAGVRHDLEWARVLVKPFGAVIALHDYDEPTCPGIKPACDEWMPPSHFVDTLAVYGDVRWPQ